MKRPNNVKRLSCLAIITLLIPACGAGSGGGSDAGTTLTLGHGFPATHPIQVSVLEPFAEKVAADTGGEVNIEIVPGGGLGPAPGTYENTAVGAQDIGWALQSYTPGRFPLTDIVELPFQSDSAAEATELFWNLYEEFPELQDEYADVKLLGVWTHEPGDVWVNGDPVRSAADLDGRTLRVPGALQNDLIDELGGSAVGLPVPELYDSLERGVIDGVLIPASALDSFNLSEVVDSGVQCSCYVAAQFLTMNKQTWDGLSTDSQDAIDALAGRKLSMMAAETYDAEYQKIAASVADEGVEYVPLAPQEQTRWETSGEAVSRDWAKSQGEIGEKMLDRLDEFVGE